MVYSARHPTYNLQNTSNRFFVNRYYRQERGILQDTFDSTYHVLCMQTLMTSTHCQSVVRLLQRQVD